MPKKITFGLPGVDRDKEEHKHGLGLALQELHTMCFRVEYGSVTTEHAPDRDYPKILHVVGYCADEDYDPTIVNQTYATLADHFNIPKAHVKKEVLTLDDAAIG